MTSATDTTTSTWNIDASHSAIEFAAKHLMITTVKGRLADASGTVMIDETNPANSSATVEFDAKSVDTRSDQRDEHLRSADFLDVEHFPTIRFASRRVTGASAGLSMVVVIAIGASSPLDTRAVSHFRGLGRN